MRKVCNQGRLARGFNQGHGLADTRCSIRFEAGKLDEPKLQISAGAHSMALRDALHVTVQGDKDGVVDIRDRANEVVRRTPNELFVQKSDLMTKFHESVAH
jgi:hypothetical protein